jgi:hypothetical protein
VNFFITKSKNQKQTKIGGGGHEEEKIRRGRRRTKTGKCTKKSEMLILCQQELIPGSIFYDFHNVINRISPKGTLARSVCLNGNHLTGILPPHSLVWVICSISGKLQLIFEL